MLPPVLCADDCVGIGVGPTLLCLGWFTFCNNSRAYISITKQTNTAPKEMRTILAQIDWNAEMKNRTAKLHTRSSVY